MLWQLRCAIIVFLVLAGLTGLAYPLAVTLLADTLFPGQASGSLVLNARGKVVGSRLIGQDFYGPQYFWPRPSATSPVPYTAYNAATGGCGSGSNLGPSNPTLYADVARRVARLHAADPSQKGPIPVDLVTDSASGLDPDISPASAFYQVNRVAKARGLPAHMVRHLVRDECRGRTFGLLGSPHVNVLLLNLALDRLSASTPATARH